ncbi:YsnF/AvaK domain-containing protein [Piscinibacter sp. XHJ-5]|uniref:YsnF/AvaK domain-containing protein n=1 Tax=Piscinibacter sp. XHJ-5 TaxID=3037797 RepID=UPI00245336E5|nr:YsnF/AvaK domain-containing protein [Piscinibacter sp. XHJ-5]
MRQTVVGVFDRKASAQRAVQVLADSGFGPDAVHLTEGGDEAAVRSAADDDPRRGDDSLGEKIRQFFADLFGPDDDDEVSHYSDAVRRGCAVVAVDVEEDDEVEAARMALRDAGAVDIDEEDATPGGATAYADTTPQAQDAGTARRAANDASLAEPRSDAGSARATEEVIPVVREEVHVGKRVVKDGGVRVYTRVVERPVDESVTLREERAHVERRPVDREVTGADMDRVQERTVEVRETVEKPVVEKVARVVEEVIVGKEVGERTERVQATVRDTEVEVEPLSGDARRPSEDEDDDLGFRADFESRYANSDERWEDHEPAYRYGHELAGEQRYAERSWDEIEPEVRRDWESRYPGSAWERIKAAVRHGWERMKD